MGRLNVTPGQDISGPIENESGPVVVPGGPTKAEAVTYTASNGLNFWGKDLHADGWVRVKFSYGDMYHPHVGVAGNAEMGGTASGNHGFGHWIIDQTADSTAVKTNLGSGADFGNQNGRIIFDGVADVVGADSWTQSGSHDMTVSFANDSTTINLTNISWKDGSGRWVDGDRVGNLGFTWTNRSGDIICRNCYWFGFPNNVWYLKNHNGRFEAHNCYWERCSAGNIRTGCHGGTYLKDCTFNFAQPFSHQAFGHVPGKWNGGAQIGIRCQSDDSQRKHVTLEGVNFLDTAGHGTAIQTHNNPAPYTVHLQNTHVWSTNRVQFGGGITYDGSWGTNPQDPGPPSAGDTAPSDPTEPKTCFGDPSTAPMSDIVNLNAENTFTFCRQDRSDWSSYEFTVDGEIQKVDVIGDDDQINGDTATGNVGSGLQATWAYTGNLTGLSAPGIDVQLNGENVTGRLRELLSYYRENYGQDPVDDPSDPTDPIESGFSWEVAGPLILFAALHRKNQ